MRVLATWFFGLVCLGLVFLGVLGRPARQAAVVSERPELVLYAYDTLVAKDSLGSRILPEFEKRCSCKVRTIAAGDGGSLLARLKLDAERGKPVAHIAWGIDQQLWSRARPYAEEWGAWRPRNFDRIAPEAKMEPGFLPFDYGVLALMADTEALKAQKLEAPMRLRQLLEPRYRRKLLLQDPRTSTPGLAFLMYTRAVLGSESGAYWARLQGQWLTLAPGWDGAYGMFLKGKAPLVWSYATSQAYHRENGDKSGRYQALLFEEGQPVQVEGAMLVKGGIKDEKTRALARSFLEFLLGPEAQAQVPRGNWMMPAIEGTPLPASFAGLPQVRRAIQLPIDAQTGALALREFDLAVRGLR